MSKALFPGSFDPFTKGHEDIVLRALEIFDEIIIVIGCNPNKKPEIDPVNNLKAIRKVFANEPRVTVKLWAGLTAELAKEVGITNIVRGVRDVKDFEYERNLADINRQIAGLETVLLFARPEYACYSSSNVRELKRFKGDPTPFLPEGYKF